MNMGGARNHAEVAKMAGVSENTVGTWATKYEWQRRAASWDQKQLTLAMRDANKMERKRHRQAIEEFRQANEEQAKRMMDVSSDLVNIIQKRIQKAEEEGEDIPMGLVSGLLRAAANISDSGRQAWATSLGVNELMQVVDQELEQVNVEDVTDIEEIPLDD
jgi:transposase